MAKKKTKLFDVYLRQTKANPNCRLVRVEAAHFTVSHRGDLLFSSHSFTPYTNCFADLDYAFVTGSWERVVCITEEPEEEQQ